MDSVRGEGKEPGEFRRDQNWIGKVGSSITEASFVPPDPLALPEHLQALERYIDSDDINFLLQTAVLHAQFELLHTFKDGNGRIGRILIPLFLYQKKQLSQPMFYLSEYLEANRDAYYQCLKAISSEADWNGWVAFFLQAIAIQARDNSGRVKAIMTLYEQMKVRLHEVTHSQYSVYLLDAIFNRPIFRVADMAKQLNDTNSMHEKTTADLLRQLKEAEILIVLQPGSGRRSATMCFPVLLNLAEGREVI